MKLDQKNVRRYHYLKLLDLIRKYQGISRTQLSKLTQISNTSVGKIVNSLIEDRYVVEINAPQENIGRNATMLKINPNGPCIIGVHIDKGTISIASVSLEGVVIKKKVINYMYNTKMEVLLNKIVDQIDYLISQLDNDNKVLGIGVSLPGIVSWPEGKLLTSPQLHWENVDIKKFFKEHFNYTVYVDNHVKTALMSESLFGSFINYKDVVCIYVGSGVGSSVMINGTILRGHDNTFGEIGHMTLKPDGPMCDCGRLGCLQTFLSSSEIEKQTNKNIFEVLESFNAGENWAEAIIERAKKYLALMMSNVICIYNPQAILLTGSMIQTFPYLVENIESIIDKQVWHPLKSSYKIINKSFKENDEVIVASSLVMKEFLNYNL